MPAAFQNLHAHYNFTPYTAKFTFHTLHTPPTSRHTPHSKLQTRHSTFQPPRSTPLHSFPLHYCNSLGCTLQTPHSTIHTYPHSTSQTRQVPFSLPCKLYPTPRPTHSTLPSHFTLQPWHSTFYTHREKVQEGGARSKNRGKVKKRAIQGQEKELPNIFCVSKFPLILLTLEGCFGLRG